MLSHSLTLKWARLSVRKLISVIACQDQSHLLVFKEKGAV